MDMDLFSTIDSMPFAPLETIPKATQTKMIAMMDSFDKQVMALVNAVQNAIAIKAHTTDVITDNAKELIREILNVKDRIKKRESLEYYFRELGCALENLMRFYTEETKFFNKYIYVCNEDDVEDDEGTDFKFSKECDTFEIWRLTLDVKVSLLEIKKAFKEWEKPFEERAAAAADYKKAQEFYKKLQESFAADRAAQTAQPAQPPAKRICE